MLKNAPSLLATSRYRVPENALSPCPSPLTPLAWDRPWCSCANHRPQYDTYCCDRWETKRHANQTTVLHPTACRIVAWHRASSPPHRRHSDPKVPSQRYPAQGDGQWKTVPEQYPTSPLQFHWT